MATYINDLRLKEIGTGESSGTWGTETNVNLELIGEALGYGTEGITTNADTHTSTVADGATDPVRAMFVKYTGTLDSACTITIAPNTVNRMQFIENATSGSQNIIISQGSGANITIPPSDVKAVYLDGAGSGAAVVDAFANLNVVDLKVQEDLIVTSTALVTGVLTTTATQVATGGITSGSSILSDTDSTDSLGSTAVRWLKGWFDTLTAGTLTIGSGSVTDSSGAISFGNENLSTTGTLAGVATNLTGTAAGLTAGTVTTNANLTGPITSSGNATSVAAQTGSGSVFVMNTSPALVTPALGTPASGVATNITGLPAASVVAGSLGAGAYTITNSSSGALTTGLLLTNATATSANTAVAFYLSPNAAGTARAASIVSEQTTSGNYADLTLNVSNGDTPFEGMSIATTGNVTIPAGNLTVSNLFANTQVSIANDAYAAITPPRNGGWCFMTFGGDSTTPSNLGSALFYYDVGSSLLGTIETTGISTSVTIATAARTGTDGTDGKMNIGIQSGVIQIENRLGTKNIQLTFV
mgnify:CR=1 FL=1